MDLLEITSAEEAKNQLAEIVKPFQQEQNQRQRKADFVKKCISCVEKNDFFQLDELLKSKQAAAVLEDSHFTECEPIFSHLQDFANQQIDNYRLEFRSNLLAIAEKAGLPLQVDLPAFSVLKGIEGKINFTNRTTIINEVTLKSIDPRRIVSAVLSIKRKLYDLVFDPREFINALLGCYKEALKKAGQTVGNSIPILQLYTGYVWSLQSQAFLQNMDKGKFKGYSIEQFAVDLWRFFESDVSAAEGGYRIKLNPGRGGSVWLIDHDGEKRQITNVLFLKS